MAIFDDFHLGPSPFSQNCSGYGDPPFFITPPFTDPKLDISSGQRTDWAECLACSLFLLRLVFVVTISLLPQSPLNPALFSFYENYLTLCLPFTSGTQLFSYQWSTHSIIHIGRQLCVKLYNRDSISATGQITSFCCIFLWFNFVKHFLLHLHMLILS